MNTFRVELLGADRGETVEGVVAFTGEDASGSFGLMARHARFMTVLVFGLARLRLADDSVRYVAAPGGLLVFADNVLRLSTRRFVVGDDAARLGETLARELLAEEQALARTLAKLRRLEAEMLQRMAHIDLG